MYYCNRFSGFCERVRESIILCYCIVCLSCIVLHCFLHNQLINEDELTSLIATEYVNPCNIGPVGGMA